MASSHQNHYVSPTLSRKTSMLSAQSVYQVLHRFHSACPESYPYVLCHEPHVFFACKQQTANMSLNDLPVELLLQICGYLLPAHDVAGPDTRKEDLTPSDYLSSKSPKTSAYFAPGFPLLALKNTSRTLHATTEYYSKLELALHKDITRYKEYKTKAAQNKRCYTNELFKWMRTHCAFCGQPSKRRAILFNGLGCCRDCDKKEWPDKIVCNPRHNHNTMPHR